MKAYLFVETVAGKTRDVAETLRSLPDIEAVDVVTGPYDIIAIINGDDLVAIGNLVTGKIHKQDGVVRTITSITITNGDIVAER